MLERKENPLLKFKKKKKSKIILKLAWFSSLSTGNFRPAPRVCVWDLVCPTWLVHFKNDATLGSLFSPLLHIWVHLPSTASPWCARTCTSFPLKSHLPQSFELVLQERKAVWIRRSISVDSSGNNMSFPCLQLWAYTTSLSPQERLAMVGKIELQKAFCKLE